MHNVENNINVKCEHLEPSYMGVGLCVNFKVNSNAYQELMLYNLPALNKFLNDFYLHSFSKILSC